MYVVVEGEADISIGSHVVETVGPTGFFGEMGLIGHTPRSATVTAKTDVALEPIDEKRFEYLVSNMPFFAIEVMRTMAARLRRMNEPLRD
jgi:CRP/FNR family cyclic AMP-dependent transcriptional regulator